MSTPTPVPPSPIRNSYWVIPGKVLAGEHPSGTTVEATRERLQRLIDAGVECFIDLTELGEIKQLYDPELPFSIEYLRKPVRDHGIPAQRAHMAEILDCIHDALQSGRCVYVHCRAGIGRTGTVIGCLLVERGFAGEAALDELNRLWQHCERAQSWGSIPETDDQVAYVRKWKARAVFAEELTLASIAAREALVGKSGVASTAGTGAGADVPAGSGTAVGFSPDASTATGAGALLGTGSTAGAGALPSAASVTGAGALSGTASVTGPGALAGTASAAGAGAISGVGSPAGASGAAAGVGLPPGRASGASPGSPASRPGGAATPGSGPVEPALIGLGLPLLDDDDDGPSDFASFNKARGIPSGTVPSRGPTPVAKPDEWPSFGKQPSGARGSAAPGQGAQPGNAARERGSSASARDAAKSGAAAKADAVAHGSARDPYNSAPDAAITDPTRDARSPARDAATTDPTREARSSARDAAATDPSREARSPARDPATTDPSREARSPARDAAATDPSREARSSARDAATTDASREARNPARDPATTDSPRDAGNAARDPATTDSPRDTRAPAVVIPNTTPEDDPLSDPEALSAARGLRDRFLGALLGLAVGDAVAAATQFRKSGTFTPVGDMIGGGPYDLPRGGWSDDTAMALCLADSLLERNGFDARDQMERYRRWQQEGYLSATGQCVGITASAARAIAMSAWRRGALFGSHDPSQLDPEPLSRIAPPVLFFFAASGQAIEQATESARTTCQAPAVLEACRSLARALHAALSGQPKAIVLEKAVQAVGNAPGRTATGISATAALTAAVAAFGATANFRDAVLYAANLGGDSDVITSVCGQLAGAYYSVKAIPTSWHNGLIQKDLIISYADRLLAHAMLGMSG